VGTPHYAALRGIDSILIPYMVAKCLGGPLNPGKPLPGICWDHRSQTLKSYLEYLGKLETICKTALARESGVREKRVKLTVTLSLYVCWWWFKIILLYQCPDIKIFAIFWSKHVSSDWKAFSKLYSPGNQWYR
jgi:hypothetical protein